MKAKCDRCGKAFERATGEVNRARKTPSGKLYCGRGCAGQARRVVKPPLHVRKARKAAYDKVRRELLRDEIRAQKAAYFQDTYTYEKGRAQRRQLKKRNGKHHHRDYCRRYFADPKKRAAKARYDQRRRYLLSYGELADAAKVLRKLECAIRARFDNSYERRKARGYYDQRPTAQERKRNAQISRW